MISTLLHLLFHDFREEDGSCLDRVISIQTSKPHTLKNIGLYQHNHLKIETFQPLNPCPTSKHYRQKNVDPLSFREYHQKHIQATARRHILVHFQIFLLQLFQQTGAKMFMYQGGGAKQITNLDLIIQPPGICLLHLMQ